MLPARAAVSFPYTPCVPDAERNVKVPSWLNDVSLYHNRGDTTFVGENSLYGDFFGLDDLFTENPRVVDGMIDIYKGWIKDFRIDGFRMDTMKHVNDEFWQKFSPAIVDYAKSQGIDDFYMFGEVAEDFSQPFLSHFTTHDDVQGVLDFPFQMSAVDFAGHSKATDELKTFFENDDWYTDGDSNVYNLPTFLGNHDRGRIGMFLRNANPGAPESELLARDKLAHALMYLSRGNPVIYYGDEQGFTGAGGDQDARQDMFPSQSPQYNNLTDPGLDGRRRRGEQRQHRLGRDADGRQLRPRPRALPRARRPGHRDEAPSGAARRRPAAPVLSSSAGVYAFSRIHRSRKHEYVVALNNAEQSAAASVPTFVPDSKWEKVWGSGEQRLRTGGDKELDVSLAPLSAVVYRSKKHIPRSRQAPSISVDVTPSADRTGVVADVGARPRTTRYVPRQGRQRRVEGHRHRRQRAVPRLPGHVGRRAGHAGLLQGDRARQRRAHALERRQDGDDPAAGDHAGGAERGPARAQHGRGARDRGARALGLRGTFQRSVNGGPFTTVGTDDSSPVYTAFDNPSALPDGAQVTYRAVLTYAPGKTVTSARAP